MKKFETNYDFVKNEEEILKLWEEDKTFNKLLEQNKNGKKFRFIDGPITANNRMHVGHAWGRTLKDTFLRYKAMNGYTSHYRNGFDGQGLWVEVEVEKELGFKTKKDIEDFGLDNFTRACVERVKKYSKIITDQSIRLGQWMNWDNSYFTLTDENITSIWHFLKKCNEKGMIKETYKPMPWCARCGTSLSEHETTGNYHEVEHEVVFFKLPILGKDFKALVWTTTPWTLTANVALAVNSDYDYVVVKFPKDDDKLLLCKTVFEHKFKGEGDILETYKGKDLEGLEFETCFPELPVQKDVKHPVVCWEEVNDIEGSGIVHIAPGCGAGDFELGEKLGLDKIVPIDESGIIYPEFGFAAGKKASEIGEIVFEELKKRNKLFLVHKYNHSYPYCWRCKEDLLFRLVKEWAIDVNSVREDLIRNAKTVKYNPEHQGKRMLDWLQNMGDWNISRRRFYGLPLPFYHCECGHLEVIGSREELREKAINPSMVDSLPELHRPWIDEIMIKCPECGKEISRVPQVGDVWLDAGIVPFSTLKYFTDKEYWKEYFPAEYVIEAHEQIRLWFYSMLFMSTVLENKAPYEFIKTSGMVVKEDGSKFSKSDANSLSFNDVASTIGSDALRYNYLGTNTSNDVRFGFKLGEEAQKKLLAFYNMIVFFNTYASIDKVDLTGYIPKVDELTETDKWLLCLTDKFVRDAKESMENYETKPVIDSFEKYVDEVSNFYIRINRRRYWKSEDDSDKKNAYYILFDSIKRTTQILAPMTPFITEYIWQTIITVYEKSNATSVHLSTYPNISKFNINENIIEEASSLRNMISLALRARNEVNIKVRQPLSKLYITKNINILEYKNILKSEVNVKELVVLDNFDSLKDEYLTLNFKNAGMILKDKVNIVKEELSKVQNDKNLINNIKEGKNIILNGLTLEPNLFNIEYKTKENIKISEENNCKLIGNSCVSAFFIQKFLILRKHNMLPVYKKKKAHYFRTFLKTLINIKT
jgi:isoleucyl-tRNA synthetase